MFADINMLISSTCCWCTQNMQIFIYMYENTSVFASKKLEEDTETGFHEVVFHFVAYLFEQFIPYLFIL